MKSYSLSGDIHVDNISIIFGEANKQVLAVDRVSFHIKQGEFVCIIGPSGCGKSTVLNSVAGFVEPTSGVVKVDGALVKTPGPDRGMVFQQPHLFPWKSVRDNVAHGPRMSGKSEQAAREVSEELIEMIGLSKFADAYPHTLSGGMQQRTAIARALANKPPVLLMDEPFGALDAQTRLMMQENLLDLWAEVKPSILFITHDIDEAIFLADRVLVMSAAPGRILQDIHIDLPRPRDTESLLTEPFIKLKKTCLKHIKAESLKAFQLQNQV